MVIGMGMLSASAAQAQPNVLVIVTDDQRLAGTMAVMPKTRKWFHTGGELDPGQPGTPTVAGGTFYPRGVANTPWCCPARASIFSGMYSHNHGVRHLVPTPFGTTPTDAMQLRSLQKYLDGAGYRTGLIGKYLNGWTPCPAGAPAAPPYFDFFTIFTGHSPVCVNDNGTKKLIWQYGTNYVKDKALEFLGSGSSQPWFLYLAPFAPHGPFHTEAKYAAADVPALDEGGSFFEVDRTDKPFWVRSGEVKDVHADASRERRMWKQHQRMLLSVDDMVDAVMRQIRQNGDDNDTIAFFTSDNGFMWGDHGAVAKARPYMASINVPLFMRAPGISGVANVESQRLAGHVDIAPTVLAAANITPTDMKDGESLLDPAPKHSFTELDGGNVAPYPHKSIPAPLGVPLRFASVMTDEVHYIETYEVAPDPEEIDICKADFTDARCAPEDWPTNRSKITEREYYDLENDPDELHNLLGDDDVRNDPPISALSGQVDDDATCGTPAGGSSGTPCTRAEIPIEAKITEAPGDNQGNVSGYISSDIYFTSSEPSTTFECKLEGDSYNAHDWEPCDYPDHQHYSTLFDTFNAVDIQYTFHVRATDSSDATDQDEDSYSWNVDASRPDTKIVVKPAKVSTSSTAWFSFNSSQPASSFECKLDSAAIFTPCPSSPLPGGSPASFAVADTAPGAEHVLEVRANNANFLDPTPARYTWSVDTAPPSIQSLPNTTKVSPYSRDVSFRFSTPGMSPDYVTRIECKLDDAAWEACSSPANYFGLADGQHSFRVRSFDLAGNVKEADHNTSTSEVDAYTWTIPANPTTYKSTPDTRWPEITVGTEVRSVLSDGCGGWYVGGLFTQVGAVTGISNLAHIKSDRTVDTAWIPSVNGMVRAMRLSADLHTLYIGGSFTTVAGSARQNLAALTTRYVKTPITTTPDPDDYTCSESTPTNPVTNWDPAPNTTVTAMDFAAAEDGGETKLYVAGTFTSFGPSATPRSKVARVQTSGTGTLDSWAPAIDSGATLNAVAAKGGSVYVGGLMSSVGSASRTNLAEIDASTGTATAWNPAPNLVVQSLVFNPVVNGTGGEGYLPSVYVGGQFTEIGNPPVTRLRAAEVSAADDGHVTPWNPPLVASTTTTGGAFDFTKVLLSGTWHDSSPLMFSTLAAGTFVKTAPAGQPEPPDRLAETQRDTGVVNFIDETLPEPNKAVYDIDVAMGGGVDAAAGGISTLAAGGLFTTPRNMLAFYCRNGDASCP